MSKDKYSKSRLSEGIGRIYRGSDDELKKISRPEAGSSANRKYSRYTIFVFLVIILAGGYFLFFNKDKSQEGAGEEKWYAIRLINNEVYYGQLADVAADPIIFKNVYYNYDQQKGVKEPGEAQNLRLVKRGQEIHGPDGTMIIGGEQILYMEPLKNDSKVLEAIMGYEK